MFFVEKLESGAGYCNYLSGRRYSDVPLKAIIEPLVKGGDIYEQLVSTDHKDECTSSCYDCIRDYSNQKVHGLLDWRLGLDLARLSYDSESEIDFTINYWENYIFTTIKNTLSAQGFIIERKENTLVGTNQFGENICLIHPLWSENYIEKLIEKLGNKNYKPLSVFEINECVH